MEMINGRSKAKLWQQKKLKSLRSKTGEELGRMFEYYTEFLAAGGLTEAEEAGTVMMIIMIEKVLEERGVMF